MEPIRKIVEGREVYSVNINHTVQEAAQYMSEKNIGAVPVLDENSRLVGIFSERDVINRVVAKGLDPKVVKVKEVMTKEIVAANADESYESCLLKMKQANCRHLPIISGHQLLGMLSLRDLLLMDITVKEESIKTLQDYIYRASPG